MRFIQEFGYTVKIGQDEAHQQWFVKNEDKLARAYPAGTKYLGTFATVMSTDKEAGNYRVFVELDSYAALDRLAEASRASGKLGKLLRDVTRFGDWDPHAPWSQGLFKAVVDTTLWDPPTG